MDDTTARILTTAVERQTEVLKGLAEVITKLSNPPIVVDFEIDASKIEPGFAEIMPSSGPTKTYSKTIFELTSGGRDGEQVATRYFGPCELAHACVRFSERVLDLDRDPAVGGAWVRLIRLPDGIYPLGQDVLSWTKVSNERPTIEGALSPDAVI